MFEKGQTGRKEQREDQGYTSIDFLVAKNVSLLDGIKERSGGGISLPLPFGNVE